MIITSNPRPREKYKAAFLIGLIMAILIFLPSVIAGKGIFTYLGDYNVQQIPFYQLAHEAIRKGEVFWNWNTDLGANFISSYSFYLLGSPFFWLTLPFPTSFLPYLMAPLLCLKYALACLTAYAYISRFVRNKDLAILGGILYAFSGFTLYNVFFNHFLESIAFFPLLLIALEEYMRKGRRGFFAIAIFLNLVANYFFFAGQAVFLLIYFIVRTCMGSFKLSFKKFFTLAFEVILGLGLAMIIILPSAMGIIANPRVSEFASGIDLLVYHHPQVYLQIIMGFFFPPEYPHIANSLPDAMVRWKSVAGWLPLFGMGGVIAFMTSKKRSFIKPVLIICLIFAMVPILNSSFYAFNRSYYARWFYMPILLMAAASVIAMEDRSVNLIRGARVNLYVIIIFILGVGLWPNGDSERPLPFGIAKNSAQFYIYALVALFVACLAVYFISARLKDTGAFRTEKFARDAIKLTALVAVIISASYLFYGRAMSGATTEIIKETGLDGRGKIVLQAEEEDQFFRVDVWKGMDNQAMFWGLPNIQAFHSIVPGSIMEFYPEIGIERNVHSKPPLERRALRSLLSVRYLFENREKEGFTEEGYTYIDNQYGYNVYEYDDYIPMGFVYNKYMTQGQFEEISKDRRDYAMLAAVLLSDEQISRFGSSMVWAERHEIYSDSPENIKKLSTQYKAGAAYSFEESSRGFVAKINMQEAGLVFFSVPYDEGFSAFVDGVEMPIEKVNVGFCGLFLEAGEHEIEFRYETPGLAAGWKISLAALIIYTLYLIYILIKDPQKWLSRMRKKQFGRLLNKK